MTVSIDDLLTPTTTDEAETSVYDALATVGVNTTAWRPGSVVRTIIRIVAVMFAVCTRLIALIAKGGFLEHADGAWLTLLARHQYGVERIEAMFGKGTLVLNNTGGGVFDLDPGDLIVRNPVTDKTYTNVAKVHLDAFRTVSLSIVAQEVGSASTSGVDAITEFVTPLQAVTCTNPIAVVGADEEDDNSVRLRCREVLGARSANGPVDAYAAIARGAKRDDGSAIGVNRLRFTKDGRGGVYMYTATPTGGLTDEDLATVRSRVQSRAVPEGVTAYTISARTRPSVPIGGHVIEWPDAYAGAGVWREGIETAIGAARPEVFHVEIVGMGTVVDLGVEFVPTLGTITALEITEAPQGAFVAAA